jgi:hypothetical protein
VFRILEEKNATLVDPECKVEAKDKLHRMRGAAQDRSYGKAGLDAKACGLAGSWLRRPSPPLTSMEISYLDEADRVNNCQKCITGQANCEGPELMEAISTG